MAVKNKKSWPDHEVRADIRLSAEKSGNPGSVGVDTDRKPGGKMALEPLIERDKGRQTRPGKAVMRQ